MSDDFRREFIDFALRHKALCFGEFKTKAGRLSPYFFNAGRFNDGRSLRELAEFYAKAIFAADLEFDVLFGPAYKGIPLVAAVAIALAESGRNVPYSFNRKEAKDHGEGGEIVGAPLSGRVLIIDDVISAGTSVQQSVNLIRSSRANPCGVVIALDRMERGYGDTSATEEVEQNYHIPVISVATIDNLIAYLQTDQARAGDLAALNRYRETYGIAAHA